MDTKAEIGNAFAEIANVIHRAIVCTSYCEEIASHVNCEEIASHVECNEIASHVDSEDIANHVDCNEIASHVDCEEIARHVDCEEIARHVDSADLASAVADVIVGAGISENDAFMLKVVEKVYTHEIIRKIVPLLADHMKFASLKDVADSINLDDLSKVVLTRFAVSEDIIVARVVNEILKVATIEIKVVTSEKLS